MAESGLTGLDRPEGVSGPSSAQVERRLSTQVGGLTVGALIPKAVIR